MELRDIEIFLVLAEELHFGRTAQRLHVTPSRVSQAIKKQERRIGALLFERDNRNVALTAIGRRLAEDLRPFYQGLHQSIERARLAAQSTTEVLRLGMVSANLADYDPIIDAFTARRPQCEVRVRHVDFSDPFGPLRSGDVDVHILWLPVTEPDLTVGPVVFTEPVALAASSTHRLADRESIDLEDLADEILMGGARPDYWREAIVPARTPSGRLLQIGPIVNNFQEMIPILQSGEAVSPVAAQGPRVMPLPGVTYIPIRNAPPLRWALIWRTAAENDTIRAFVRTAQDTGPIQLPGR